MITSRDADEATRTTLMITCYARLKHAELICLHYETSSACEGVARVALGSQVADAIDDVIIAERAKYDDN